MQKIACVWHKSCFVDFFHEKCRYCQSFLEHGIKQNVSSLVARITKHDTKEDNLVESREDKGQVTEDTETKESYKVDHWIINIISSFDIDARRSNYWLCKLPDNVSLKVVIFHNYQRTLLCGLLL